MLGKSRYYGEQGPKEAFIDKDDMKARCGREGDIRGLRLNAYVVNGLKVVKEVDPTQCIDDRSFLHKSLSRRTTQQEIMCISVRSIFERHLCRRVLRMNSGESNSLRYIERIQEIVQPSKLRD